MKKEKNSKGFSLIELIIAIAILVILTGLLAPQFMRYMEKSREAKDMQTLDIIYGAMQVALANEDAYDELIFTNDLLAMKENGMALSTLFLHIDKATAFRREFYAIAGIPEEFTEREKFSPWTSKSVIAAGGNNSVYMKVDKNMKITVWIGNKAKANTTITSDYALSPEGLKVGNETIKTVGSTFFISK